MKNKYKNSNNAMLYKLRLQFVLFSMLSLIIMQSVIIYICSSYIYNKMLKKSDILINDIYTLATTNDTSIDIDARFFYITIDTNDKITNINTTNNKSIRPKEAAYYYRQVINTQNNEGFYNGYRYKLYKGDSSTIAIFLLRKSMLEDVNRTISSMIVVSICGISVMLIFLIFISKKMVIPIAKSYQKQKEFITSASHELKTPLAVIKADADVLMMDSSEESFEWLEDIKSQVDNMTTMTNNLVCLARMDERDGNIIKSEFSISELTKELVNSYNSMAIDQSKLFIYKIEPNITYNGDINSIRQLFSIILDNAFKYGLKDGCINVSLKKIKKTIIVEFENDVEVIDNDMPDKMFDRFYRSDSNSSKIKGYGLGLSIAKSIVNEHNGSIYAKFTNNKSILITIKLPTI